MANQEKQGSGRHGHKDTQEPYAHHGRSSQGGSSQESHARSDGSRRSEGMQAPGRGGDESLKSREYRDEQGNIHHHTKSYTDQHGRGK